MATYFLRFPCGFGLNFPCKVYRESADSAVTTEPRGFTSTQARPADAFTSAAVPGRSAALDVCVASPEAAAAGEDAAESAFKRKLVHYQHVIPELQAAGIAFRPLIWTADGRPHPATTRTLKYAAEAAARKRGGVAVPGLLARWKHEITIAIIRRRVAMLRAVLPKPGARELWMLAMHGRHGWTARCSRTSDVYIRCSNKGFDVR